MLFRSGLSADTPIKIRGVSVGDYNVSTKVSSILGDRRFTYNLGFVRPNLVASPSAADADVTVETDTVTGASPYIFNVSMRSVWGVNGMHADGAKATGFRSMVVAQFTAISLQKDDRAFVKYNKQSRRYDSINFGLSRGGELSQGSSSTNSSRVYHLDPEAVYRPGWDTTHIKMSNDAVIQIVSVFAIGFNNHFSAIDGADASITNSNSNFGQFALFADGFKRDAFSKDDRGYITQIITPRSAFNPETIVPERIEFLAIDFPLTRSVGINNHLYLAGYNNRENLPPAVTQGFKVGANTEEVLYLTGLDGSILTADVIMTDKNVGQSNNLGVGTNIGEKRYPVVGGPTNSTLRLPTHGLVTGETIRIYSDIGEIGRAHV